MAKILIIEDEAIILKIYRTKLLMAGYEVETAINGEEGLKKIKSFLPDLVLLDLVMPKVNGIQFLRLIKKEEALKNIPVIVLTNMPEQESVEEAMSLGVDSYLLKINTPPNEVLEKIKTTIERNLTLKNETASS